MSSQEEVARATITHNVRRAMFEAGLTQAALAEQMTITRETLYATDELAQIATATGVPFSDLAKIKNQAVAA